ncbi:uncharacterized protein VTP21DRAFT_6828 [Calcarisporiella thermophila]|uniref:uncharacterized protein n=1 Tax=Calcarisporiella thermophila TaxID=911321 RepID=UPI0037427E47
MEWVRTIIFEMPNQSKQKTLRENVNEERCDGSIKIESFPPLTTAGFLFSETESHLKAGPNEPRASLLIQVPRNMCIFPLELHRHALFVLIKVSFSQTQWSRVGLHQILALSPQPTRPPA